MKRNNQNKSMDYSRTKTLYWKICDVLENIPERTLVMGFMMISIMFWGTISGYLKIQRYHADEWIYLQTAYALKNGYGFNIYGINGLGIKYGRYVYSILIAPACFIENISLRLKVIAFINAISLSSSAVPVYLLSKEMLKDKKKRCFAVIIALTMPYMNYCASFLSENILIPIGLWIIYLNYVLIQYKKYPLKKNVQRICILIIFLLLSWFTKDSGKVFSYMEIVTIFMAILCNKKEIDISLFKVFKVSIILILAMIILFWGILFYNGNVIIIQIAKNFIESRIFSKNINSLLYVDSILNVVISFILVLCIIPIIYHLVSFHKLEYPQKLFAIWLFVITSLLLIEVVNNSYRRYYTVYGDYYEGFSQIWFRYIYFLYVPYIICFFKATEIKREITTLNIIIVSGIMIFFWNIVVFFYRGAQAENAATYSLLYWVRNYGKEIDIHTVKTVYAVIIACIIGLFIYVYSNHTKFMVSLFVMVWIPIQLFNSVMCHKTFVSENYMNETSIIDLRDFVLTHKEDTFLLVDIDDGNINSESLWRGDVYLDSKNIIRCTPNFLHTAIFPCDLNLYYDENASDIDFSQVKYLLICSKLTPYNGNNLKQLNVGNGQWYTLYELENMGNLPTVNLVEEDR